MRWFKALVMWPQSGKAHKTLSLLYQTVYQSHCSVFRHSRTPPQHTWTSRLAAVYCHLRALRTGVGFWKDITPGSTKSSAKFFTHFWKRFDFSPFVFFICWCVRFFFFVWVRSSNHCLAALYRSRGRFWAAIILSQRPEPSGRAVHGEVDGLDRHLRKTWSTVCSSPPHSQVAEEAIPHLYKQERKRPTPVRRRLSGTNAVIGRVIPGWVSVGAGDESTESRKVVQPLRLPLVVRPVRLTYVVVKWTDDLLCGGHKRVSGFEAPCIRTRWTGCMRCGLVNNKKQAWSADLNGCYLVWRPINS